MADEPDGKSDGLGCSEAADDVARWLDRELARRADGIGTFEFMGKCLYDDRAGYYRTRDPLGRAGDFVTAPEISQVFGELVGIWVAAVWQAMGSPRDVRLVELGPGRGTLMADALRALKVVPALRDTLKVELVEISETLRDRQAATLTGIDIPVSWHPAVPPPFDGATILVANEFLDALPVEQAVWVEGAWRRRRVVRGPHGQAAFAADLGPKGTALYRAPSVRPPSPRDGDVMEWRPLDDLAAEGSPCCMLAAMAAAGPLAALFIDYGYEGPAIGDTLQAVRNHAYEPALAHPGAADLTAHVDFSDFARRVRACGLRATDRLPQAAFLSALGIVERSQRLMLGRGGAEAARVETAVQRLMAPQGMGSRFRTLAVHNLAAPPYPFVDEDEVPPWEAPRP